MRIYITHLEPSSRASDGGRSVSEIWQTLFVKYETLSINVYLQQLYTSTLVFWFDSEWNWE